MKLDDFVAVSAIPGLFKIVANKTNGLIIEDLDSGKRRFASARKHQFTPLATIGIYTEDDTTELKVVFQNMKDQLESNPPVAPSSSAAELTAYFEKILPDFDRDRVHSKDIKKAIQWFTFLHSRDLLVAEEKAEEEKKEEKETESEVTKED